MTTQISFGYTTADREQAFIQLYKMAFPTVAKYVSKMGGELQGCRGKNGKAKKPCLTRCCFYIVRFPPERQPLFLLNGFRRVFTAGNLSRFFIS
jgi:hypothetical protein